MTIKEELFLVIDNLNEALEELSKLMREKLKNNEIEEYKKLKQIYDKLNFTTWGKR